MIESICSNDSCAKGFMKSPKSKANTCSRSCAVSWQYQKNPLRRSIQAKNAGDPAVRKKKELTSLERHGVKSYSNFPKQKLTRLKNHGVETVFELDEVQAKVKETILIRHGEENIFQVEKIMKTAREKAKNTLRERYGVENPSQIPGIQEKVSISKNKNWRKNGYHSRPELNFLQALGLEPGFLAGYSVDGLNPDLKLVFEYDGEYFHSTPDRVARDKKATENFILGGYRVIRVREIPLPPLFSGGAVPQGYWEYSISKELGYHPTSEDFSTLIELIKNNSSGDMKNTSPVAEGKADAI